MFSLRGLVFIALCAHFLSGMDTGPVSESSLSKDLNQLANIDKIGQPLFINTFLGKLDQVQSILEGFPEYLPSILDCNTSFKCPLEVAIMRGHYEIADLLLEHMKVHIKHTCIEDLFMRWNAPMIHNMITRDDKQAVKYILETIGKANPEGEGLETKFSGMTALHYAKWMKHYEMAIFLADLGCKDDRPTWSFDSHTQASSDSPRKVKSDGLLTSSGLPRKSSSGHLNPTKSGSKRMHIDLHFRSRSSSLTASGSPRKSSKSPREKSGSRSTSKSAPDSPKSSEAEDDLDGSSLVESDAGSTSSSESARIKKKGSGGLRKISPRFKK